jgi:hypothetical protein
MSLYAKRLERGRFIWPTPADGVVAVTAAQLGYMLEGIVWTPPAGQERDAVHGLPYRMRVCVRPVDATERPLALMDCSPPSVPMSGCSIIWDFAPVSDSAACNLRMEPT